MTRMSAGQGALFLAERLSLSGKNAKHSSKRHEVAYFYLSVTKTYLLCKAYLQPLNSLYTVIVNT